MDELAELRKQRHNEYLRKREIENERLEKERLEKEEYDRLHPKQEEEDEQEQEEEQEQEDELLDEEVIEQPQQTENYIEDDDDEDPYEEDEDDDEGPHFGQQFGQQLGGQQLGGQQLGGQQLGGQQFDAQQQPLPHQPPQFHQMFGPQPPQYTPIFNPNLFNNHGNHHHHFGGYGGHQSFSGQGHQLSSNDNSPPHYSQQQQQQQQTEPIDGEEKRSTFLNSIETRFNKSPELVSENEKLYYSKKKVVNRVPKDYNVKKLVDLCLSKMTVDLTLFQSQLKLMSGELIERLIQLMVTSGRLTRTKLNQIVASGARIYSMDLSHQYAVVNNDFLSNCFKYMVEIQQVYFRNCVNISDIGMEIFRLNNFEKNLKILDIRDNRITDVGIKNLKNLENLEELYLGSTLCTDLGIALLVKLVKLKTLDVSKCKITDSSMDLISRYTELKHLYLSGTQITDVGISKISKLPNLVQLYLSNCLNITNQSLFFLSYLGKTLKLLDIFSTKIGLNGFIHLKMFKQLQYLVLPGRDSINDSTIGHLNVLSSLKKLDLSDYRNITDISPLTNLQQLTELLLSNTKVDDRSITNSISTMNSLQVLSLNKTMVTTQGVSQLLNLNLNSLSLSSTLIDNKALNYLGKMKSLQNLDISFNNITDIDMDLLKPIADTLSHLDLRGTDTFRSLHFFSEKILRPPVKVIPRNNNNNNNNNNEDEDDDDGENGPW